MDLVQPWSIWWLLGIVQLVGLGSAWLTRMAEGSARQTVCQLFFLACLTVVGLTAVVAVQMEISGWFLSSTTLALMVLVVTLDFTRMYEPHVGGVPR